MMHTIMTFLLLDSPCSVRTRVYLLKTQQNESSPMLSQAIYLKHSDISYLGLLTPNEHSLTLVPAELHCRHKGMQACQEQVCLTCFPTALYLCPVNLALDAVLMPLRQHTMQKAMLQLLHVLCCYTVAAADLASTLPPHVEAKADMSLLPPARHTSHVIHAAFLCVRLNRMLPIDTVMTARLPTAIVPIVLENLLQ